MNKKRITILTIISSLVTTGIFYFITKTINVSVLGLIILSQTFLFYCLEKIVFNKEKGNSLKSNLPSNIYNAELMIEAIKNNDFDNFEQIFYSRDYMKAPVFDALVKYNRYEWIDFYFSDNNNIGSFVCSKDFSIFSEEFNVVISKYDLFMKYFKKNEPEYFKKLKEASLSHNINNF